MSNDNNGENGRTGDKIAAHVGMKTSQYNRAKKIIEVGSMHDKEKCRTGTYRINQVYTRIINEEKRDQYRNEKQKIDLPSGCQLLEGDFMEVGKQIPDNSISLILTDPPYLTESLPIYEKLGIFANRVLKEGGCLVTFVGQYELLKIGNLIEKSGLKCRWPFCVKHTGHHASIRFGTTIDVAWKLMLLFIKGNNGKTAIPGFISDFIESEPPTKLMHEWEQSTKEAEHVIKGLTVENQIVLDPFMGYATNGIAALKLNRKFIGIEIDPVHFSNAQGRLSSMMVTVKK